MKENIKNDKRCQKMLNVQKDIKDIKRCKRQ